MCWSRTANTLSVHFLCERQPFGKIKVGVLQHKNPNYTCSNFIHTFEKFIFFFLRIAHDLYTVTILGMILLKNLNPFHIKHCNFFLFFHLGKVEYTLSLHHRAEVLNLLSFKNYSFFPPTKNLRSIFAAEHRCLRLLHY